MADIVIYKVARMESDIHVIATELGLLIIRTDRAIPTAASGVLTTQHVVE